MENRLVSLINKKLGQEGIAYRLKQAVYQGQFCDINVDRTFGGQRYYAIEVKSMRVRGGKHKGWYGYAREVEQYNNLMEYAKRSGREPLYCFIFRYGTGHKTEYVFMKAGVVSQFRTDKGFAMTPEAIRSSASRLHHKVLLP